MTKEVQKVAFNRKEGAAYLGIAENTLVKLLNEGRISFIRVGRRILIPKQTLDRFLDEQAKKCSS